MLVDVRTQDRVTATLREIAMWRCDESSEYEVLYELLFLFWCPRSDWRFAYDYSTGGPCDLNSITKATINRRIFVFITTYIPLQTIAWHDAWFHGIHGLYAHGIAPGARLEIDNVLGYLLNITLVNLTLGFDSIVGARRVDLELRNVILQDTNCAKCIPRLFVYLSDSNFVMVNCSLSVYGYVTPIDDFAGQCATVLVHTDGTVQSTGCSNPLPLTYDERYMEEYRRTNHDEL